MAVRYISASASAQIGGDLYAVIMTAGSVRLIVGDVQGKGLAAVQTAATVLGAFREAAYDAADLALIPWLLKPLRGLKGGLSNSRQEERNRWLN